MKDTNSLTARIGFSKMMLLLSGVLVLASVPITYFLTKDSSSTKIDKVDEIGDVKSSVFEDMNYEENSRFVMSEDFFGKPAQEVEEFDPSPPPRKPQEEEEAAIEDLNPTAADKIFTKPAPKKIRATYNANPQEEVVTHGNKKNNYQGSILELLADKDYPSSVASKSYDLSRVITTDSFIPAVMYTAVNSEIPSRTVLAIVESDVVGFHGTNILIPRGSKVEGVYEKIDNKHARRMQITWFKITRPDGIILKLDAESSDPQGASGLTGYLDQRLKDRYGGAILLSTINALAQLSVKENDIRQLAAVESFGREFGTLTAQIIRENLNAMPIIMIRQGTRFNIRPYQNIYFRDPNGFDKATNKTLFTNS